MISFVLLFAVAFAAMPQDQTQCATITDAVWNAEAEDINKKCSCPQAKQYYNPYSTPKACVAKCPEGSTSNFGECKKCIEFTDTPYANGDLCAAQCPYGSVADANKICRKCADEATNKLYDHVTSKCVATCPTGATQKTAAQNNGVAACVCEAPKKKTDKVNNQCVETCPTGTKQNPDDEDECIQDNAPTNGLPQTNKADCEGKKGVWDETKTPKCQCTKDGFKVEENGQCVAECEDEFSGNVNGVCKKCANEATNKLVYPLKSECVATCPPKTKEQDFPGKGKACVCDDANPISDNVNKQCVASCPKGTKLKEEGGKKFCEKDNGVNGLFVVLAMALVFLF